MSACSSPTKLEILCSPLHYKSSTIILLSQREATQLLQEAEGLFHSPTSCSGQNRVSKHSFWWYVSIGSSPFAMFTCVGLRQSGRSPKTEGMRPKYLEDLFMHS